MSSEGDGSDYGREVGGHEPKKRSAGSVKTRQHHIAQIAQNYADSPLTTLAHHLDRLWMHTAFAQVRKDSAPGVDGMTAAEYAKNAGANLADLLERAKSGRYKAPPVKRKWIPKNEHELRAIGIPTLEDKILQRAIAMLLEPIYEQDFLDCSYGFRPRRSAHQALTKVRDAIREENGGWVLDVDIKAFFDTIPHQTLREVLPKRFEKYGLQLHPEKTRLVDFCHPWKSQRKPGTVDFLGFTIHLTRPKARIIHHAPTEHQTTWNI